MVCKSTVLVELSLHSWERQAEHVRYAGRRKS